MASLITKRVSKNQVSSYGVVVTDDNDRVKAFQEKPSIDNALGDTINTGIYLFEPEIFHTQTYKRLYNPYIQEL